MLNELQSAEVFPLTGAAIVRNILVALLCGLAIGLLYRRTYKGPGYSVTFVNSLVLLSMIVAMVIMIIGNNLARAFGLVGALSIIRFRTAVKDTLDIVYVFFALVVGMASGAGYTRIAMVGTLVVGVVTYALTKSKVTASHREEHLLQFGYSPNGDGEAAYLPVLKRHCRRHTVINTRALGNNGDVELSFYVDLREREGSVEFVRELQTAQGVSHINLFSDEEEF